MHEFSADELSRHAAAMRRLARALLGDAALAEDAVQQAFVTALQRPPAERTRLAGWLRRVVHSCAADLLRAEGRRRRRDANVPTPHEPPTTPAETAQRLEGQAAIGLAVRDLGEPYATAVWLRYYEDLSPTEIAHRLGEPVKTVKTRLARALQRLRGRLRSDFGTQRGWIAALVPLAELPTTTGWSAAAAAGAGWMQSKVFGGLAVLLVVALAATLWRTTAAASDPSPADTATLRVAEVESGPTREPAHDVAATAGAAQRIAADGTAPTPEGPAVQVRVLDKDGAPLPFVQVWHSRPDQEATIAAVSEAERRRLRWLDEAWLRRFGAVTTTDADGIARWPWQELPRRSWTCVVRHGSDYGQTHIPGMALPHVVHELRLQPDRSIAVEVVDARRMPAADVPIAVRYVVSATKATARRVVGVTDERGCATLHHVQLWSESIEPRGDVLPATVAVALPGIDVSVAIDAALTPHEPIVLTLPRAGSIEVTFRSGSGEPIAGQQFVLDSADAQNERTGQRTDDRGVARFAHVPLGRDWRLGHENAPPDRFRTIRGPVADSEVVSVLWQPKATPILTGTLLRDGTPVVGETVRSISADREVSRERVATDAHGRFRMPVLAQLQEQRLTELTLRTVDPERGVSGERAQWRGDFTLTAGEHDLGVLELQPEPLVVQVQFTTATGQLPDELAFAVQAATGPLEDPWHTLHLSKRRDGDGRFSVFGEAPRAPLRLVVHSDQQFLPVPATPFAAGARDLHVELRRGGSVRASIVVAGQLEAFCLQPLLVPTDRRDDTDANGRFDAGVDPRVPREQAFTGDDPMELAYVWPAVVPGRYRLEVRSRGLPDALLVVPDVVVRDGERNADEQLQHLRIVGLQAIEVTLPQANDATASPGRFGVGLVAVLDGDRIGEPCWQVDSPLVLFASRKPIDFLVRLDGHRDRIVRGVSGKQTIEMQPGLPVTLRWRDAMTADGATAKLALHPVHDALTMRRPAVYSATAGGMLPPYAGPTLIAEPVAGAATLRLPAPGRYRILASRASGDGTVAALAVTPAEIEVGAEGGTFELQVTQAR